ncbi:LapA family protein [Sandaracinobacter sp. RS1-74]|uniref:LapA family protein n=1 Tax=Sandaracinobacteroides sayramensis TaxID=2913411 RepID=UPI001EDA3F23|nr:LapA family protein [Sandaracinobacteroides sayramensis]MCG2839468.1 LapA family protein [Sandaracinobacteroides sayramensis]
MNTVRAILIALLVAGLTLFSVANSIFVPVNLGFQQFDVWLPLMILLAFALGFVPIWAWLSTDRMMLRRRVQKLEASLGKTETELAQAKVELLRPPAVSAAQPAPPPGT